MRLVTGSEYVSLAERHFWIRLSVCPCELGVDGLAVRSKLACLLRMDFLVRGFSEDT